MTVTFANAWVLLLLWLVPPAAGWWYVSLRRRDKALLGFVSAQMQRKIRPVSSRRRLRWQTVLMSVGLLLAIVAAARPQWGTREETVYQRGRDLVIALDVSRSMLARDVHPNRLARAKADLHDLLDELRGDRAALVAFRRSAVLLCPLTTDYTFLRQALEGMDVDSAPPGATDIGAAIEESLEAFESDPGAHKAIILISDGEDLSGRALFGAGQAAKRGIPIFAVGLGDRRGSPIPAGDGKGHETHEGVEVITRLDHNTLHALAETSGGAYVPVGTAGMTSITLGTLYREHLRRITAQDIEETQRRRRVERYQGFLLLSVLLMLTAAGLSPGRLKVGAASGPLSSPAPQPLKDLTPPRRELKAIAVFLSLSLAAGAVSASTNAPSPVADNNDPVPPGRRGGRQAQRLYRLGRHEEAAKAYLEAAKGSTARSQLDFKRNAAAAFYRAKQYDRAAELLREVESMEDKGNPDTGEALGASLYRSAEACSGTNAADVARTRARRLKSAGEAFREAARAGGGDTAEHDLGIVVGVLPEAEEEARIAELMERHGNTPAFGLVDSMLNAQREILANIEQASTNATPSRIAEMESAAAKQDRNADLWVPLKGKLLAAMPSRDAAPGSPAPADVEAYIEQVRDSMTGAAEKLRDLDPGGPLDAAMSEGATYQLWKGIAPHGPLLGEDIRRQAAALEKAEAGDSRLLDALAYEQDEAGALTQLFADRFSEAVPEGGSAPPAPPEDSEEADAGEAGGISAETREEILRLAAEAAAAQEEAAASIADRDLPAARPHQQRAHDLLKEIETLLPREPNQDRQSSEEQQDPGEQEQDPQPQEDQEQSDSQDEAQPGEPSPSEPDEASEPEDGKEEENDDRMSEEEMRRLIEKALQREKEHAEEQRQRNRIPLPPTERDW